MNKPERNKSIVLWMVCGSIFSVLILCISVYGYKVIIVERLTQKLVFSEFLFLSYLLTLSPIGWVACAIGAIGAIFLSSKLEKSEGNGNP